VKDREVWGTFTPYFASKEQKVPRRTSPRGDSIASRLSQKTTDSGRVWRTSKKNLGEFLTLPGKTSALRPGALSLGKENFEGNWPTRKQGATIDGGLSVKRQRGKSSSTGPLVGRGRTCNESRTDQSASHLGKESGIS